ncbi:efflux RND transporter periplasmic adaptor subunit [Sediminicurvatus halobius]|uniref:efflux RND transporter periplasmic adaptor subunit n=1 Tax=Sediminicurvatus halobius TaxID=2182432 RepID=UPI001304935A|nr:efflux RND transporter periplasmic adaptor subunit [Spiribacter halobius]UEX79623.1 efflux RND transporter periplasmic adaptor subunit [Spiribacter halobius]
MGLGFIGLLVGGGAWFHLRAEEPPPAAPDPVPVAVTRVQQEPGYVVETRYAGRLEPARSTALAFERGGTVTTVRVDEGDAVDAGDVIARLDTDRLRAERDQLLARRAETTAQLEIARLDQQRIARLHAAGHASAEADDEARLEVRRLEAAVATLEAGLRAIDVDLRKSELRAPYDGTVAARHLDEGAVASAGTPVLDLLESTTRRARIGVPPDVAETLQPGEGHTLLSGASSLSATLLALRPDLSGGTRTVEAIFDVAADSAPPYGELVELVHARRIQASGFWVPLAALTEAERGLWALLTLHGEPGARRVVREAVEVLHVRDEQAYVRGTLRSGTAVVTAGPHRLVPGQPVSVVASDG